MWLNLYGHLKPSRHKTQLKVNDSVRISRFKHVFSKGYDKNWSTEIFVIDQVKQTSPVTFTLRNQLGEKWSWGVIISMSCKKLQCLRHLKLRKSWKHGKKKGKFNIWLSTKVIPKSSINGLTKAKWRRILHFVFVCFSGNTVYLMFF